MKLLPSLAIILLQFQNILGMTIRNTLSNSRPHLGETITLSCNITGGIAESSRWWKDKHRSQGAVLLSHNCLVVPKEYTSRLRTTRCDINNYNSFQLSNVQTSDSGVWVCAADGQEATTKLSLDVLGPPSAPSKLKVVNTTDVAVTLEWISEFDGGSEQRFYVQYKQFPENWDVASEVPQGGITDPGLKKAVYHRVMDLESNVWYMFRVRSKNSISGTHTSNFSDITYWKTSEKPQTTLIDHETSTSVFHLVGGVVVGGVIVLVAGVIAVFVLWKRALARLGTTQSLRPINGTADKDDTRIRGNQLSTNDTADYDDTRIEFKTAGNSSVHANVNTGTEYENDAFHPKRPPDQNAPLPMAIGHHNPVRAVLGNEPTSSDDEIDVDAYDYVDSPSRRLQNDLGENPAPEPQDHQMECAISYEQFGQDVLRKKIIGQERQESEESDSNLSIPIQGQPGQSTTESSSSQSDGDNKQPQSHSNDDMAHSQVSTYANLGRVEPVQHGEYLDLRHVQPCLE